jgi:hypothetical protein
MRRPSAAPVMPFLLALGLAAPASAALPRTYDIQRVDSPAPVANGNFGRALAGVGDVDADGKQDMIVGNDKHGTRAGQVFVISGADGSLIRELQRPDTDTVGTGRPSGFGAAVGKIGFNQTGAGPFNDIGSCPLGDGGDADAYCDNATVGPPDGIPDLLATASGVDVDPVTGAIDPALNNDLGVAYVFDGKTGALLRKFLMPQADRQMQVALGGDARYGRAALTPNGMFPCVGHAGIGACPSVPAPVAAGDVNGGGIADVIVAATDFDETPANSHPSSPCAATAEPICPSAGRVYVYYGEAIAGTAPTVVDDTPDQTITDLYSKPDGGSRVGTTLTPVGDLGRCTTGPAPSPGSVCPGPSRTADGRADYVSAGPDFDAYGFNGTGTVFLIDGATGTILRRFDNPEPQPVSAMGLAQNGLIQPAFGDLGQSTSWDFLVPSTHQNIGGTAVGRSHVINGDLTGRERFIPFAQLNDPTPHSSGNFGASAAGLGQVDDGSPTNEVLVGAIGPHAPGTNREVINDVHMFRTVDEQVLQSFPDPVQEPGSGFGEGVAPLGDLNGDGFLDLAISGGGYDLTTSGGACDSPCANAGRLYIYRSDNSPAAAPPPPPPPPPAAAPTVVERVTTVPGPVLAGRAIEIEAGTNRIVRRAGQRRSVRIAGDVDAYANRSACERNQRVSLQRRVPGSMTYRTFKTVRTTAGGTFSTRTVPTRTYLYRARLARTSQCQGTVSNRERITVVTRRAG